MLDIPFDIDISPDYKAIALSIEKDFSFEDIQGPFNNTIERIFEYYNQICSAFDSAPDLSCLEKIYSIDAKLLRSEESVIITLLEVSYKYHYRSRDVLQILGRFLFAHFTELHSTNLQVRTFIERLCYSAFRFIVSQNWCIDDAIFVRMAIYNILDIYDTKDASTLLGLTKGLRGINYNDISFELLNDSIERFVQQSNIITPIKTDWLYAYIFKNRFGYLYCRKFFSQNSRAALPFTIQTYSLAYKGLCSRIIQNSAKVVAFEIGEIRRSSEYHPKEDSFFYNFSTMKYE